MLQRPQPAGSYATNQLNYFDFRWNNSSIVLVHLYYLYGVLVVTEMLKNRARKVSIAKRHNRLFIASLHCSVTVRYGGFQWTFNTACFPYQAVRKLQSGLCVIQLALNFVLSVALQSRNGFSGCVQLRTLGLRCSGSRIHMYSVEERNSKGEQCS